MQENAFTDPKGGNEKSPSSSSFSICNFSNCNLKSIQGYDFCFRHIDAFNLKNEGQIKQCEWTDQGQRCNHLVHHNKTKNPEEDNKRELNLCVTHLALEKLRGKRKTPLEPDQKEKLQKPQDQAASSDDESKPNKTKPTTILDVMRDPSTLTLMDSSDSLDKIVINLIKNYQKGTTDPQDEQKDSQSCEINQDYDHDLSDAGVYTKEEIVRIFKVKMSKLQLLYKKQMQLLSERMRDERDKYLSLKRNEETSGSCKPPRHSKIVKAAKKYRSLSRSELYLKRKFDPSLVESPYSIYNASGEAGKCVFSGSGGAGDRCRQPTLPLSKFCPKHILSDVNQVLFSECGGASAGTCKTPVVASVTPHCPLHLATSIGCLNSLEAADLLKLDEAKLNSLACSIPPEYPTEALRAIAAKRRAPHAYLDAPSESEPDHDLAEPIGNGSGLIRIKQEILDQSNLSSEDLRDSRSTIEPLPPIEVKQEEKEYTMEKGDLEVIEERDEVVDETTATAQSRSSYSSSTSSSSGSASSSASTSSSSSDGSTSSSGSDTSSSDSDSSSSSDESGETSESSDEAAASSQGSLEDEEQNSASRPQSSSQN